jgi:hypothetical protein
MRTGPFEDVAECRDLALQLEQLALDDALFVLAVRTDASVQGGF